SHVLHTRHAIFTSVLGRLLSSPLTCALASVISLVLRKTEMLPRNCHILFAWSMMMMAVGHDINTAGPIRLLLRLPASI
ncbi:hypothetical protein AMECASPLE_029891, partial [Ameca splendens]